MQRISDSYTAAQTDLGDIARVSVECGDPAVDSAIRLLCTAWIRHGLDEDSLSEEWACNEVDQLFESDSSLIDAIDGLIRATHRARFSRPRAGKISETPRHRPGIINHRLRAS